LRYAGRSIVKLLDLLQAIEAERDLLRQLFSRVKHKLYLCPKCDTDIGVELVFNGLTLVCPDCGYAFDPAKD
jgi:DNA-directed RNA polymerase subunit RPC12/RpoP